MEEIKVEIKKNKIKLGILGCGFACHEGIDKRLNNWFNRPESKTDFVFSFVSARFKEYEELNIKQDNTETEKAFKFLLENKLINYLYIPERSMSEAEARNLALQPLLQEKCDYILILDLQDEQWEEGDIHNLLYFLNQEENQLYSWIKVRYKNIILDGKQYIDDFSPPRIFKVNHGEFILDSLYFDNDFLYIHKKTGEKIKYLLMSSKEIPKELCFVKHYTWINNQYSRDKIFYQLKHFGHSSYKISPITNDIEIDYSYYDKNHIPYPIIYPI